MGQAQHNEHHDTGAGGLRIDHDLRNPAGQGDLGLGMLEPLVDHILHAHHHAAQKLPALIAAVHHGREHAKWRRRSRETLDDHRGSGRGSLMTEPRMRISERKGFEIIKNKESMLWLKRMML